MLALAFHEADCLPIIITIRCSNQYRVSPVVQGAQHDELNVRMGHAWVHHKRTLLSHRLTNLPMDHAYGYDLDDANGSINWVLS